MGCSLARWLCQVQHGTDNESKGKRYFIYTVRYQLEKTGGMIRVHLVFEHTDVFFF